MKEWIGKHYAQFTNTEKYSLAWYEYSIVYPNTTLFKSTDFKKTFIFVDKNGIIEKINKG